MAEQVGRFETWLDLTRTENITLTTVRVLARRSAQICSASVVVEHNWDDGRGLTYDQTFRALRGLVKKGRLTKPARGVYQLAEGERDA